MRYSQPFGTPQPPLGSYPRFVNGNPVTGTEGSIPPATAFDEDQIEIVTVIANAGLTPDHNDLTQLWQALVLMIAKRFISEPVTKTVHGPGADFADLHAALDWASNYTITQSGFLTLMVAAGRWTYTDSIEISHPQSQRIAIQGSALLGASPSGANMSVTGYHNAADGTNQIIYLRSIYATELSFTGGISGFVVTAIGNGATLRYLLLTGSQTIAQPPADYWWPTVGYGSGLEVYGRIIIDGISCWGFGHSGMYVSGGAVDGYTSLSCAFAYCGIAGIYVEWGSVWIASAQVILTSSNYYGMRVWSSNVVMTGGRSGGAGALTGGLYVRGNNGGNPGDGAITLYSFGTLTIGPGSNISTNNAVAVWAQGAGTSFVGHYSNYIGNTLGGIVALGTNACWANYSNLLSNGPYTANASGNGYIELIGSSFDGPVYGTVVH